MRLDCRSSSSPPSSGFLICIFSLLALAGLTSACNGEPASGESRDRAAAAVSPPEFAPAAPRPPADPLTVAIGPERTDFPCWPAEIPAAVPRFNHGTLTRVIASPDGSRWELLFRHCAEDAVDRYTAELAAAGWKTRRPTIPGAAGVRGERERLRAELSAAMKGGSWLPYEIINRVSRLEIHRSP